MVRRVLLAFLGLVAMQVLYVDARADGFDGITIVEFADEAGWNVIRGQRAIGPTRKGSHILTFVSGKGSYAALMTGGGDRLCVAWAADNSYTGQAITFGLPASVSSMRASPEICQPFTLTYQDALTIQVAAQNKFDENGGAADRGCTGREI